MSYAPPSRRRDEDEEFQQPFTSTGRVGGSFVAPPTVPQQEPDFSTADFSAAFGDLNQPQQSEPDFSTADFGAAFADLAPSQPSAPAQREPIEQPKGWSGWDTAKTFGRSMVEGVANTIPFVDPLVVTDYEAAPAPTAMGAVGRYGNIGQDVVTGIGEFASGLVGGPAGPAVTAGGSSLLRSMERNDIEAMRRYMADNPSASIHEARSAVGTEDAPVAPMDSGDYMVAGLDAALANPAIRVGRWGSEAIARNPSFQTAVKSTLGVLGFDVGTGTIQAAADIINRENATPDQWNDALWENRDELAAGAAMNAAISGGAQGIDIGAGILNRREHANRINALEREIQHEVNVEAREAEIRDELLAEALEREAEMSAIERAQTDQAIRDYERNRASELRAREEAEAIPDMPPRGIAPDVLPVERRLNRDQRRYLQEASMRGVPEEQAYVDMGIPSPTVYAASQTIVRSGATSINQAKRVLSEAGFRLDNDQVRRAMDVAGSLSNVRPVREGDVDALRGRLGEQQAEYPQSSRRVYADPYEVARREAQLLRDQAIPTPELETQRLLPYSGDDIYTGGASQPGRETVMRGTRSDGFIPRTEDVLPTNLAPDANAPQMPGRPVGGQSPQPGTQTPARATQASSVANEPDFSTADPAVAFGDLPENQRMDARQPSRMAGSETAEAEAPAGNRRPVSGLDNFRPNMPEIDRAQYGDIASSDPKQRDAILERIRKSGGEHPLAPVEGLPQTQPVPGLVESLEGVGASQRDADGNLPKRMGAINLEKFAGDDEATQNLLAGVIKTNEDQIEADRIREGRVLERAARIHKFNDIKNVEAIERNQPLNDAEATALDAATMGSAAQLRHNPSMENAIDFAKRSAASNRVASAQGAALGARNIVRRAMLSQLPSFERSLVSMADEMLKGGRKSVPEWALKRMMDIKDKDDLAEIVTTIQDIKRKDQGFLGWLGGNYRYSNMLSSPVTLERTFGGNVTNLGYKGILSPAMGRAMDMLLPESQRIYASGENRAAIAGAINGFRDAWNKAVTVLGKGYKLQDMRDLDYKNLRTESRGGLLNPMNLPSRVMTTLDEFTSTMAENMHRFRLAHRKAYFEAKARGLKGDGIDKYIVDNVDRLINSDVEIDRASKEFAKTMTHMEDAIVTQPAFGKNLPPGIRASLNLMLNLVQPFWKTLVNMGKEGAILSGAGFGTAMPAVARKVMPKGRTLDLIESFTEGMTPHQKRERFLQAAMGTATMGLLTSYALEGNLTGAAPKDPRERERWYGEGNKPYNLKIFGKDYDYTKFGPVYYPLSLAAGISDAIKHKKLKPESNVALLAAANAMGTFTELPIFAGLGSLAEATQSPTSMERFASNIASQFVPLVSAQRWVNRQGWTGTTIPEANTMGERLVASTVAGRYLLPAKLSSYGEELNVRNPRDPLYVELARLDMLPPSIPRDISIAGERYPLEPEERRTVLRAAEQSAEMLRGVMETPSWNVLTDGEKRQYIDLFHKDVVQELRRLGVAKVTPSVIERTKEERQSDNAPQQPGTAVGER